MADMGLLNQVREDVAARRATCETLRARYLEAKAIVESAEVYLSALEGELEQDKEGIPEEATLGEMVCWVLRDGSEQSLQDITDEIERTGFHVGGKKASGTVSAILSGDRRGRFVKGSRRGYWKLKHPPLSAASDPKEDGVIAMSDFQTGLSEG